MAENTSDITRKANKRYIAAFALLLALAFLLIICNVCTGSVELSLKDVLKILSGSMENETAYHIIRDIRMPRLLAAFILGGALSVSGFLLQTFFGNPIAGPFVLGVSSGAKLMVALVMIYMLGQGVPVSSWLLIAGAFVGAMLSMGFVLCVSAYVKNMSILVICGIMIGYICSAVTDFLVTFASDTNIVNLHNWSMGSCSGIDWPDVYILAGVTGVAMIFTFLLSKPAEAYQLGETYAASVGVNIRLFRMLLILLSSLLAACVTAFAGPVSFVGIAVPHLMKNLFHTAKPILMIPACFLGGGVFCLFCDLIARTAFAPVEVSISSVTAVFGAPVVIYMLIRRKR